MHRAHSYFFVACLVVAVALVVVFPRIVQNADILREDALLALDPSAERAFYYGEKHFNGGDAFNYDVARAEEMFRKAEAIDPSLHYLKHEIARIEFLKGNFKEAMRYIDAQIEAEGDTTHNSYYIRGLIQGYKGDYDAAVEDYKHYLRFDPHNWAAINDYCWVLLKAGRMQEAAIASASGLRYFPDNPWLLNTNATALYELGFVKEAVAVVRKASEHAAGVTEAEWILAYPGNDPKIARQGITTLQSSIASNKFRIEAAAAE